MAAASEPANDFGKNFPAGYAYAAPYEYAGYPSYGFAAAPAAYGAAPAAFGAAPVKFVGQSYGYPYNQQYAGYQAYAGYPYNYGYGKDLNLFVISLVCWQD